MKVAFELPTKHITELKALQDYNFLLAHKVLDSEVYRRAYGPGGLLDNSAYELGEPLSITQLRLAERQCQPDIVIAPDWLGDREKSMRGYREASTLLHAEVAGVVQGEDTLDMLKCYGELVKENCPFICLPFRLERVEVMQLIKDHNLVRPNTWFHFLGLKSMAELDQILALNLEHVSLDTSKPIKAALHSKQLDDDLRNLSIDWEAEYSEDQVMDMHNEIVRFKGRIDGSR